MANNESGTKTWFKRHFGFEEGRETGKDTRNIILVIATLIAAATFQAGVNPPGGVWQDNEKGHIAGTAIYAAQGPAFYIFLFSNTVAFQTSLCVIMFLTYECPFRFEILVAAFAMTFTYSSAVFAVTPDKASKYRYVLLASVVPYVLNHISSKFLK